MGLNLRHLAIFREVARGGSVSAGARAAFVSQPAATQAIAALERHFAAQLFRRSAFGMTMTPAGEALEQRAGRSLEQLREAVAEARRGRSATGASVLSVSQLEALIGVVEHGRFGRAARAARLARPTLHRAARALEARIGVALFERTSFGVQPTREAERLAARAQLAFAELEQARAEIGALAGAAAGATAIGAMPLARSFLVPRAVLEFTAAHPGHAVSILDGPYETMLAALRVGKADILVGALREPAPAADVHEEALFDDPLAIIVRAAHPLARGRAPDAAALVGFPWIVARAGSPLRRRFEELFVRSGLAVPPSPIECNSLVASRALLLDSDRVMLLSAQQVRHEVAAGELVVLPHPFGRVVRPIGLTTRRDWRPTDTQHELLAALRRVTAPLRAAPARVSGRRARAE